MSAAIAYRAPTLYQEGLAFWDELVRELQQHAETINSLAERHGLDSGHFVEWRSGRSNVGLVRKIYPSTEAIASMTFEHWGPTIKLLISGQQHEDLRFYPQEHEVPVSRDLDGRTVAVLGEGRSYAPNELASYIAQFFRRCFPDMALPCTPTE